MDVSERIPKIEVDEDYIRTLECKLKKIRKNGTQLNSKDILNDLETHREDRVSIFGPLDLGVWNSGSSEECHDNILLFHLITKSDHCFEDNFIDQPLEVSYLRRKLAPQTVAVDLSELSALLEADHLQLANLELDQEVAVATIATENTVKDSETVHWMNDAEPVDLLALLNEYLDDNENLEIVATDCARKNDSDAIAFLVTCWVLFDQFWMPKRYFAAMFKATTDYKFILNYKLELDHVPSYTRVTAEAAVASNRHCWLIFTASRAARLFVVQPISLVVEEIESIGDIYPGLDLGDLPGSAIRSHCLQTSAYRWSVLGFDTGYVIATALSMRTNFIEDRSKLKFSGAISVLLILQHAGREDKISVLISSTLGPAAVWTLSLSLDRSHFEWKKVNVLEDTRGHDAVICSASCQQLIAIGTYGGFILVYKRIDLLSDDPYPASSSIIEMHVPVVSMIFLRDDILAVLTTNGLHTVERHELDIK
uniref:Uncharacterized protein n=1 Tax=Setaria digitata TaxID=48799 RepID=A0A915PV15_9BILA